MPRGVFWVLLTVLLLGACELLSFAAYSVAASKLFSYAEMQGRRASILEKAGDGASGLAERQAQRGGWTFKNIILHPFLGYHREPSKSQIKELGFARRRIIDGEGPPLTIGITGGSVSESFFVYMINNKGWRAKLQAIPAIAGRPVDHVFLGLRGYKQPQQLMAVSYYLTLGEPLDVLINLDGFNEIFLGGELHRTRVFPAYPYHWRPLTRSNLTPAQLEAAGLIAFYDDLRVQLATTAEAGRWSVTANVLWYLLDRVLGSRVNEQRPKLHEEREGGAFPYFRVGPLAALKETESIYPWLADVWMRASMSLDQLAKGSGFHYLHFLQPNQYVPGSKRLSAEELAMAERRSSRRVPGHVEGGYPELLARGEQLRREGVRFYDLTPIYEDLDETIYSDGCCHVNRQGEILMAGVILRAMEETLPAVIE